MIALVVLVALVALCSTVTWCLFGGNGTDTSIALALCICMIYYAVVWYHQD